MLAAGKGKGHLHGGESGRCRYIQVVTLRSRHDDFMLFVPSLSLLSPPYLVGRPACNILYD
jgi:hypothetical protein